jgi:hypothetical protein
VTLPRTVAHVLFDHLVSEIEYIDRLCLSVFQSRLQQGAVQQFSSAIGATSRLRQSLVRPDPRRSWRTSSTTPESMALDMIQVRKGERNDDIARPGGRGAQGGGTVPEGILFVSRRKLQ